MIRKEILKELCATPSPSGYEEKAVTLFEEKCLGILSESFGGQSDKDDKKIYDIHRDAIGNSIVRLGLGDKKVMISAHIDEIALQVQHIDDNGFIHFIEDGGIDRKVLLGSTVTIINRYHGDVMGVIGKTPIHIERQTDSKDKVNKVSEMKIDCGFSSKEEAQKFVSIGDPIVVMDIPFESPDGNKIFSRGIDDKSGVWAVIEALRVLVERYKLKPEHFKDFSFYFVACVQEEVGADGAVIAAKDISPNVSIDYDVTFATDDDNVKKEEYGDITLGKGGCIAFGPDKNVRLCHLFEDVCEQFHIPYQPFAVGNGGTNTESIKLFSQNPMTETILISIPQRNMHTQVEVCDIRDIQSIVNMTVESIEEMVSGNYKML